MEVEEWWLMRGWMCRICRVCPYFSHLPDTYGYSCVHNIWYIEDNRKALNGKWAIHQHKRATSFMGNGHLPPCRRLKQPDRFASCWVNLDSQAAGVACMSISALQRTKLCVFSASSSGPMIATAKPPKSPSVAFIIFRRK
jgi:hypothetical protein